MMVSCNLVSLKHNFVYSITYVLYYDIIGGDQMLPAQRRCLILIIMSPPSFKGISLYKFPRNKFSHGNFLQWLSNRCGNLTFTR
jgi:hypothetical protein